MTADMIGAIKERLVRSSNILIASHIRPDGDAIGSLLGLGLALIREDDLGGRCSSFFSTFGRE